MKKILAIILVFLTSCNIVFAQSTPRWHGDELFYPHVTTLGSSSWIMVNNGGQTSVIQGTALASALGLGSSLTTQLNVWSANQTYTAGLLFGTNGFIQLPSAKVGTYIRQPYFDPTDSTLYITDANGNSIPFKSQAHNDNTYATSEGATNLGATYMTLSTAQTVTASKTFSGVFTASNKLRIPYGTLPEETTAGYIKLNSANNYYPYYTNSNGTWKQIITLDYLQANYPAISNYAYSVGTQSLNPVWNFSGTINATTGKIKIKETSILESNEIGFETSAGASGMYVGSALYIPDDAEVQNMIDKTIKLSPTTMVSTVINLETANRFYYTGNSNVTFTFTNMKQTTFELFIETQGITMNLTAPSGYTIDWVGAVEQPSDQGDYKYIFEVWGTVIKVYLAYRD